MPGLTEDYSGSMTVCAEVYSVCCQGDQQVPLVSVWLLHSTWKGGRASLIIIHPVNLSHTGSKRHTPGPRLSRRAKPREGVMLTRHHWTKNLHDAGYRPRRMKFPQELNGYVFKTKASHLDGGHRLWSGMERDGLRHATLPKTRYMKMTTLPKTRYMKVTTTTQSIPARSSPGTRTAPSVAGHQDGGEKHGTDGPKPLRARNNITSGTCNVRSLRAAGKAEELTQNEEIPMEHPWTLEKLSRNVYPKMPQTLLHWQ